ncbi:quinone oxidoreductase family protein [Anaplasma capra]|uniref:quinone oxidoreductase family protein n=1 Tax=Anaplasma capra TaxID=1562740 RepID=UPI0021D5A23C|nr:quinone oxidoreductase [Anaplasma capra]MCU7611905.1 quinone oxidoreductase [Anaplasma capra]MCU7612764.1 quinone oxidoreductase [Anaplasma capra]
MSKAVVIDKHGDASVLKYVDVDVGEPGKGEVLIEHTAIGLNRYDVEHRDGTRKVPSFPAVLGVEAVGVVKKLGPDTEALSVGDRVGYCTAPGGAYSEARVLNQRYLYKIADDVSDELAAAIMLKGMAAHYLTHRIYDVRPGTFVLVYGVSGGVGRILCQWASYKGGKVIGVVESNARSNVAREVGCSYVMSLKDDNIAKEVMAITGERGVNVVYDPLGAAVSKLSFSVLGHFGLYASYGSISGRMPSVSMSMLSSRSWFITSPSIQHYKRSRLELGLTAMEIYEVLRRGHIKVEVGKVYKFTDIAKAHKDLEDRKLTGLGVITM